MSLDASLPDPKPEKRKRDPDAMRRARYLIGDCCAACGGGEDLSVHHVVFRSQMGDDVEDNFVLLCGHGTAGCHGAFHGNPYVVETMPYSTGICNDSRNGTSDRTRRDAEWVGRRIGHYIDRERPDVIAYIFTKLGDEPGREFLRRFYYVEIM